MSAPRGGPLVPLRDAGEAVTPVVPLLEAGGAEVAKLTRDIHDLHAASGQRDVSSRAEEGRLLLDVQRRLGWGGWRKMARALRAQG